MPPHWGTGQLRPQPPQLKGSLRVSTQLPEQSVWGQAQPLVAVVPDELEPALEEAVRACPVEPELVAVLVLPAGPALLLPLLTLALPLELVVGEALLPEPLEEDGPVEALPELVTVPGEPEAPALEAAFEGGW
jgi:hypothetical protein